MNEPSLKAYFYTWGGLLGLLALTCGSAFVPLGSWNVVINYAVALAKTLLVMIFFMHLRRGSAVVRLASATGLVFLALLAGLTLLDRFTRGG